MLAIAEAEAKEYEEAKHKKQKSSYECESFSSSITENGDLNNYNDL
ncbi:18763_t:CDS:1, partial [Racocetra fulgida]